MICTAAGIFCQVCSDGFNTFVPTAPLERVGWNLCHFWNRFGTNPGLEMKIFFREPNYIFISFIKVFWISNSTYLDSLQKFEGAAGEFKGALGYWHPLISSPATMNSQTIQTRFWWIFLLQILSKIFFCPGDISKTVRSFLTVMRMKGLKLAWLYSKKNHSNFWRYLSDHRIFSNIIWKRNVNQNPLKNSLSDISWIYVLFQSYCQKFPRSWRKLWRKSQGMKGLRPAWPMTKSSSFLRKPWFCSLSMFPAEKSFTRSAISCTQWLSPSYSSISLETKWACVSHLVKLYIYYINKIRILISWPDEANGNQLTGAMLVNPL